MSDKKCENCELGFKMLILPEENLDALNGISPPRNTCYICELLNSKLSQKLAQQLYKVHQGCCIICGAPPKTDFHLKILSYNLEYVLCSGKCAQVSFNYLTNAHMEYE